MIKPQDRNELEEYEMEGIAVREKLPLAGCSRFFAHHGNKSQEYSKRIVYQALKACTAH